MKPFPLSAPCSPCSPWLGIILSSTQDWDSPTLEGRAGLPDQTGLQSEPLRNAMAVVSDDSIADHFKQQQDRDRIDQKHRQRPERPPPQKVIEAECARVNTPFARDDLQSARAFCVIDPESHQLVFV